MGGHPYERVVMGARVGLIGVVVAAGIAALASLLVERRSNRRLRLDAAMRAGGLLEPGPDGRADPAASAARLLALTQLDHAQLAVALLVDVWPDQQVREDRVSSETVILVIDAALRSDEENAQLMAAELLCRNAKRLNPCQSLHWPSAVDGRWLPHLAPKARLLLLDGMVLMTVSSTSNENALLSVAVRLYGCAYDGDPDPHVKGRVGTLIKAIVPELEKLDYTEFMQGTRTVSLAQLRMAAAAAVPNPDRYLAQVVQDRSGKLRDWAAGCPREVDSAAGALAD
jgi:hypothetical protein